MPRKRLRDVIFILPGFGGSVLENERRVVWDLSVPALWNALRHRSEALDLLAFPERHAGAISATRVIRTPHLIPGLAKSRGYKELTDAIRTRFEVIGDQNAGEPSNLVEFPYDWRRDIRVSAAELGGQVERSMRAWRERTGESEARAILIGHSMGGLVARYYLEVLQGFTECRALFTLGTPHRGATGALEFLANGYKRAFLDLSAVLRSFPAAYQLLPIYPVVRSDGQLLRAAECEQLPNLERKHVQDGLEFHRHLEAQASVNEDNEDYRRQSPVLTPIVGIGQTTMQSAILEGGRLTVAETLPDGIDAILADGDGTVPRVSATPVSESDSHRASFVVERHSALQCDPYVLSDMLERIAQMQVRGLARIRVAPTNEEPPPGRGISLALEDLYHEGEQPVFGLTPVGVGGANAPQVVLTALEMPVAEQLAETRSQDEGWRVTLPELPCGVYEIEVAVRHDAGTVRARDIFTVIGQ
jgi:pimeloyl-ACP methyl ester carboxylesterase